MCEVTILPTWPQNRIWWRNTLISTQKHISFVDLWLARSFCKIHLKSLPFYGFLKKWSILGLFFVSYWSFETNNTNFETNFVKKCRSGDRIRTHDTQFSPITTKPQLPLYFSTVIIAPRCAIGTINVRNVAQTGRPPTFLRKCQSWLKI